MGRQQLLGKTRGRKTEGNMGHGMEKRDGKREAGQGHRQGVAVQESRVGRALELEPGR